MLTAILWTLAAFISGAIPYSVWLGRLALRTDIRRYGDHNPGAFNVMRAGGKAWGVLAILLDMLKGGVPVGAAWFWGELSGGPLVAVSLAPILGHAFSPFLNFKGGKAIAVTGGVWGGLTYGGATVVMALFLSGWYAVLAIEGWAVVLAMFSFLLFLLLTAPNDTLYFAIWAGSLVILTWKHRADLAQWPRLRPWVGKLIGQ